MNSIDLLELFGGQCDDAEYFLCSRIDVIQASTGAATRIRSCDITKYNYSIGDTIILPFIDESGNTFKEISFSVVHIRTIDSNLKKVYLVGNSPLCSCNPSSIHDNLLKYELRIPEDILGELSTIEHAYVNTNRRFGSYVGKLVMPSQANVSKTPGFRIDHNGYDDILFSKLSTMEDKKRGFRWYCETPSEHSYNGGISGVNRDGKSQYTYSVYNPEDYTYILPLIAVTINLQ